MAIIDANIAREIAEQNPELHQVRQTAFGTDYLKDIEQGTGTAQYYGGWGNIPGYGFMPGTGEALIEEAPTVDAPNQIGTGTPILETSVENQGTVPIAAQPTTTDYLGEATEGTSTIGNLGQLATGDTPLDLSGSSQDLIQQGTIETPQEWYSRTYGDPAAASAPYGIGPNFPADYESLDNEERAIIDQEYANAYGIKTTPEGSLIDKIKTGAGAVKDVGLATLGAIADIPLGLITKGMDAIPESKSKIEYEGYNPTQQQAIDAAYGTGGVMEGYNPVSIAGEGALATINERIANREANVSDPANDKTLQELKALRNTLDPQPVTYIQDPDTGDAKIAERIAAEERAANLPDAYTILGEEGPKQGVGPKYSDELNWRDQAQHTFGSPVEEAIGIVEEPYVDVPPEHIGPQPDDWRDNIDINVQDDYGGQKTAPSHIGFDYDQAKEDQDKAIEYALTGDIDVLSDVGDTSPTYDTTPDSYTYEGSDEQDEASNYESPTPVDDPRDRGGGDSGGGGGGKIVCTMMNDSYGFGDFRNKIWLRQSKNLAPEYQKGYHILFLPLVKLSKKNKLLKKTLEHIAVHRTIDIRQEARGKRHLLGRIYRKILEPICYWVGKYAKR